MLSRIASLAPALFVSGVAAGQEALVPFDVPQVQLRGYETPFQRLFDCDADGDLDAVGAKVAVSGGVATTVFSEVYSNPGNGAYEFSWNSATLFAPSGTNPDGVPLEVGDLDGDGYDDFALAAGAQLCRYRSNPPGFQLTVYTLSGVIRTLAIADFDGDGTDDVAVQIGTSVEVRLAAGPVLQASSAMSTDTHDHLFAADTDGDPLPDIVLASGARMQLFAVEGSSLVAGQVLPFAAYGPMVDGGDVDQDGDTDIVAFHMAAGATPPRVEVFRRAGPVQWTVEPPYQGGPAEYLADIDGDGDPDGVCCGSGGGGETYPEFSFPSTFELALNQGGVFDDSLQIPGIASKSLAGAQDVDADGDTDLVAGRCVYFNRGAWKDVPASGFPEIESPVECADFDTDGDLDAWVETSWPMLIESQAWRSRGDGTFALQPLVMDPPPAGTTAVGPRIQGDFDGDGDADVILGVGQGSAFLYEGLWRNSGGGSFHFSGPCAPAGMNFEVDSPIANQAYLVGDFEADGDLDLVMRHTADEWSTPSGKALVYRNDGHAYFVLGASYTTEQAMAITDFDQDGVNDLIVSAPVVHGGGVLLLRGMPAGSPLMFAPGIPLSAFWGFGKSQHIDVADFNGDGYPDVGAAGGSTISVHLNGIPLGMGTKLYSTVVSFDDYLDDLDEPRAFGLDVDQDGLMDVIAGPFESSRSWRVHRQMPGAGPLLGPTAFEPGIGVVLSPWSRDDADGDGDIDVWGEFLACSVQFHGAGTGAREQYGAGSPGTAGVVPTLGATGPFRAGEDLELRLRGAQGGLAYLGVTLASASMPNFLVPGLTLLVDPAAGGFLLPVPVSGSAGGPGAGGFTLALPVQPAWAGVELYHQVFVLDAGAPSGLLSSSNGMRLLFGP